MPAKRPAPRLALIDEPHMTDAQRALLASLRAGPRGASITPRGPFAVWMHAPEFGELAQKLGVSFTSVNRCENGQTKPSKLAKKQIDLLCRKSEKLKDLVGATHGN